MQQPSSLSVSIVSTNNETINSQMNNTYINNGFNDSTQQVTFKKQIFIFS